MFCNAASHKTTYKTCLRYCARHGMQYHCYADDIQIYATVGRDQCIAAALLKIEACVMEVADWMVRNQLKLNKDKSQAIIFHNVKRSPHVPVDTYVNIAGQRVRLASLYAISVCYSTVH